MSECPNREELMTEINEVSFAVDDVKLFLDTHPCNEDALDFFEENSRRRNEMLREYAKHFGPLTIDTAVYSCEDTWNWIDSPWPWQEGGC